MVYRRRSQLRCRKSAIAKSRNFFSRVAASGFVPQSNLLNGLLVGCGNAATESGLNAIDDRRAAVIADRHKVAGGTYSGIARTSGLNLGGKIADYGKNITFGIINKLTVIITCLYSPNIDSVLAALPETEIFQTSAGRNVNRLLHGRLRVVSWL
jgi:hypothetical protein